MKKKIIYYNYIYATIGYFEKSVFEITSQLYNINNIYWETGT